MSAIIITLLIPLAGTIFGSAFVFLMKNEMPELFQKIQLGFASGVMVAASVWSLLLPALGMGNVWQVAGGLLGGFAFLLLIDNITPHMHPIIGQEGPKSRLSRTTMLALAVTIHNFPAAQRRQQPSESLRRGQSERHCRAYRQRSGSLSCIRGNRHDALPSAVCRRSDALCSYRGTDSRGIAGQALKRSNNRFCHRLCLDDGARCRYGIETFKTKLI